MSSSKNGVLLEALRRRKRRKYSSSSTKWVPEPAEEDRISSLSDEVIHRIMSFMNTKCAVQTCVLSKRWESLWKSLPYLEFDSGTFPFRGHHPGEGEDKIISFNNFITQMLFRRHHTNLVKVRLNFHFPKARLYAFLVEGLIAYAVDHNVQQLSILWYSDFVLPESFYTCQSLEALYVDDSIRLSKFLALPALKSLNIQEVDMSHSLLHPWNFSGCPNLETLILEDISLSEDATLFINAPKLKRLKLYFEWANEKHRSYGCKIVIDAPRLTTFQYRGYAPIVLSSEELASINDVYFDIHNQYISGIELVYMHIDQCPEHILRLIDTFKEFRHAKSLRLSLETVEALAMFPSLLDENRLPISNLKYLKINLGIGQECNEVDIAGCVLNFFLNSSTKFKFCDRSKWLRQDLESWDL